MKKFFATLSAVFRWLGKFLTTTRTVIGNLVFLLLMVFIFTTFFSEKKPAVVKDAALVLSLAGNIVEEKQPVDPFSEIMTELAPTPQAPAETLFQDILDAIHHAATDARISCILLDLKNLESVGFDQMQTVGAALEQFKKSGKKVIAAEDFYRQKAYYLASYASEIYLNPMGGVDLHGLGAYPLFFREALEKLRVNYLVFRVGSYKSAVEPILRDGMSMEAKEQMRNLLTPIWASFTADIQRSRSLPAGTIDSYTNEISAKLSAAGGNTAQLAIDSKLVDGLKTREELRVYLGELTATPANQKFSQIGLDKYLQTITPSYQPPLVAAENTVGIIVAEGMILDGQQPVGTIGGDTLAAMIRKARLDSTVKAVVLRVNSGGGSAFASEVIRQEIVELKKSKKPLVVSMGSTAASGGYWISADADEIWASDGTITGSIGIFAAIPTFEKSLAALGIHSDGIGTTPIAAGLNLSRPLPPSLQESLQMSLEYNYQQFLTIVAKGRKMEEARVRALAEGRVFGGQEAQKLGLVDKLGTLADAIASAAKLANIESYSASYIEKPRTLREELLEILSGKVILPLLRQTLAPSVAQQIHQIAAITAPFRAFLVLNDPSGIYAQTMIQGPALLGP